VVAIPGASSVAQLERNAEAADLELTDEEDERLTGASDRFSPLAGVPAFAGMARERLRR
jgi:aryl-alcohol dehydrogenase-like predicted oxidoreductase